MENGSTGGGMGGVGRGGVSGIAAHANDWLKIMLCGAVCGEEGATVGSIIAATALEIDEGRKNVVVSGCREDRPEKRGETEGEGE